jgi:hypothetical protein
MTARRQLCQPAHFPAAGPAPVIDSGSCSRPPDVELLTHQSGGWDGRPDTETPAPERGLLGEEALAALEALPEEERAAVAQAAGLRPERSVKELAEQLGLPRSAMVEAKARGLAKLRQASAIAVRIRPPATPAICASYSGSADTGHPHCPVLHWQVWRPDPGSQQYAVYPFRQIVPFMSSQIGSLVWQGVH